LVSGPDSSPPEGKIPARGDPELDESAIVNILSQKRDRLVCLAISFSKVIYPFWAAGEIGRPRSGSLEN
jgi:hypothetical protein